ncbi:mechanosensitive ion channel family protein [Bacteriovoracaceae bacterium]|nr:mechanosensitive ion channel family protein [Bacteriovoracaceae bacterium]
MDKQTSDYILEFFKIDKVLLFIFFVILIVFVVRLINHWTKMLESKFIGKRLLILQISTIIGFFIYLAGITASFYFVFEPSREVLVTIGGSAAVAIGFALKDLVGSIIAGFILLLDRPFQVGDRVQFGNDYGEILSIGLRSVRLNTLDDNLVTIPNSKFLTETVATGNNGALDMMVVANFYLSLFENLETAQALLYEVVITSKYVYLEKAINITFEEVAISNTFVIKVSVKSYVFDVKYEKAFLSDLTSRGNQILMRNNVQRPVIPINQAQSFSVNG